jgi:hypothetical protein
MQGSRPMLDRYTCECMVSIINIDNGIKEPTRGHQNCNANKTLVFNGCIKVRESLYTQLLFGSIPVLTMLIVFLGMIVFAWYIDPHGIENKSIIKYPYPTSIKICEFIIIDIQMVSKKDDTNPTPV